VRPQLHYVRPNWRQSDSWAEIGLPIDRWNDRRILANRLARESLRDVMDPLARTCSSVNDIFEETWKLLSTPALNLCPVLANTSVCEHVLFFMLMTAWTTQHALIDAVARTDQRQIHFRGGWCGLDLGLLLHIALAMAPPGLWAELLALSRDIVSLQQTCRSFRQLFVLAQEPWEETARDTVLARHFDASVAARLDSAWQSYAQELRDVRGF